MSKLYRCTCCSTRDNIVIVEPILKDGFLTCPHCTSNEIEEVE